MIPLNLNLEYQDIQIIKVVAVKVALPPRLLESVMIVESGGRMKITSSAGAIGAMQVLRSTAAIWNLNPEIRYQNILCGALWLKDILNMFNGNLKLSLAAYNSGPGTVKNFGYKIPPYAETINYVHNVLTLFGRKTLYKQKTQTHLQTSEVAFYNKISFKKADGAKGKNLQEVCFLGAAQTPKNFDASCTPSGGTKKQLTP
jgi:soluble lytic murein transglycosylase-like protein